MHAGKHTFYIRCIRNSLFILHPGREKTMYETKKCLSQIRARKKPERELGIATQIPSHPRSFYEKDCLPRPPFVVPPVPHGKNILMGRGFPYILMSVRSKGGNECLWATGLSFNFPLGHTECFSAGRSDHVINVQHLHNCLKCFKCNFSQMVPQMQTNQIFSHSHH